MDLAKETLDFIGLNMGFCGDKLVERLLSFSQNKELLNNEVAIVSDKEGVILYIDLIEDKYLVDLLVRIENAYLVEVYRFQEKSNINFELDRDYFHVDEKDLKRKGYIYTNYFYITNDGLVKLEF